MTVLEAELKWRKENERFSFYEPNGAVEKFVRMVGENSNLVYTLSTANGVGKTAIIVNLAANLIFGPQNKFFDFPIFKDWPFPKRARYITHPKNVEEIGPFHTEIQKWWPKGRYTATKEGRHYYSQYKANGWILDVMTYDQQPTQFEGPNIGVVFFDEPPPKSLWTPNVSRLRDGGMIVVAMTPLTEAAWFYDEVVPRHSQFIVYADVEQACKQHGTRGHLEHDRIQQMISEYDADEREARIGGKAMYLKGLVFKQFDPNVHILKAPVRAPLHATLYNVVDPHADKPFFAIWAWPHKNGDLYIVDEHPNEDFFKMHNCQWTRDDYKRMYSAKETGYEIRRVIDRHYADAVTAANKKTLRQEMAEIGMHFDPSYSAEEEIETGVLKVREYLKFNAARPVDSINRPRLFINPHCLNTIKAFQYWSIDPKTGKYKDDYKDPMDCIRYLLMSNPQQSEPLPAYEPRKLYG